MDHPDLTVLNFMGNSIGTLVTSTTSEDWHTDSLFYCDLLPLLESSL